MDSAVSKKVALSVLAALRSALTSCGGSSTPEPATPTAEKHEVDKNSCGAGPNHSCGAHEPANADSDQRHEDDPKAPKE